MARALIVFDGDDTLWSSEVLYDRARALAAEIVAEAGIDGDTWSDLQRRLDLENVRTLGFSATRFPLSCVQAYEELARQNGGVDADLASAVEDAARSVFSDAAELVPNAAEVIAQLASRYPLALLTKGETWVQRKRLTDSGLARFFERVEVVAEKSEAHFTALARSLAVDSSRAWSVGNSIGSDIAPALRAGYWAAWIDAYAWEREREGEAPASPRLVVLQRLDELCDALVKWERSP